MLIPVLFVYDVVATGLWGKTIGKHLLGIRVCSRGGLGRPGWVWALKPYGPRYLVLWIPYVGALLALLIPLPLLWTPNRQGLHDEFADTLVIREAPTHSPGNPDDGP